MGEFGNVRIRSPQIGISILPWAAVGMPNIRTARTWSDGYTPLFFCVSMVRLVGIVLSAGAAGPLPLPSAPWHTAQYVEYICAPETGDVFWIGTGLILTVDCWLKASKAVVDSAAVRSMETYLFIGTPLCCGEKASPVAAPFP